MLINRPLFFIEKKKNSETTWFRLWPLLVICSIAFEHIVIIIWKQLLLVITKISMFYKRMCDKFRRYEYSSIVPNISAIHFQNRDLCSLSGIPTPLGTFVFLFRKMWMFGLLGGHITLTNCSHFQSVTNFDGNFPLENDVLRLETCVTGVIHHVYKYVFARFVSSITQ